MRLSIFWRVVHAQSTLVVLILALSLFALTELNRLTKLNTSIVTTHYACIEEEKSLRKIFLRQVRDAEKYLVLGDESLLASFLQGNTEFSAALERINNLIDSPTERELLRQIRTLHAQYSDAFKAAGSRSDLWQEAKTETGEKLIGTTNELIGFREDLMANKIAASRDQAADAAALMAWLTIGGMTIALLLAYFHARGVNRPLKKLAREMRQVGKGQFDRSVDFSAPLEVHELAQTFNWMAQQLMELDKMKSDFIAHISHELRTPLTAIREGTALLLEGIPAPPAPSQREVLEVVANNSERLFRTISSILELSKMEVGMMEYDFVPCDLSSLVVRCVESLELIARKKTIDLVSNLDSHLPMLPLDEEKVEQVINNLLSNALKFTPEGGKIVVSTKLKGGDKTRRNHIEFRVVDSGGGILPGEIDRVFNRFYQSSNKGSGSRQGSGLGLAIARHIVEAHNGKIWVESEVGHGAAFVFTLPVYSIPSLPLTESKASLSGGR